MRRLAAAAALALWVAPAAAERLVLGLSADEVNISANFTGTGITVFGSVEDPDPGPILSAYDIVVVMQGPSETAVLRRKDPVLGLWVNRVAVTLASVPEFYAVVADRPVEEIGLAAVMEDLGIGIDNLILPLAPGTAAPANARSQFTAAFVRLKQDEGHYYEHAGAVTSPGGSLFRADFTLPANVPDGSYDITAYLFLGGDLLAVESAPLTIAKTGAEEFLFDASRSYAWLYGLAVVTMAIFVGWLGGVIFRRD